MSIIRDTVEREREATRDTLVASLRANVNISGGGVITWDSNGYFNSTSRFVVALNGRGAFFSTNGYFDIIIPTSGTIQGVGGAANVTATSAGIPVGGWQALYYILPTGSNNVSIASNFRIVYYTSDMVIPDNWVLIAINNLGAGAGTLSIVGGKYTLHKGESIDTNKYSSAFVLNADTVDGVQGALLGVGGAGYAWVDETANRAVSTVYTNTTGHPIMVIVSGYNTGTTYIMHFLIDGITVTYAGDSDAGLNNAGEKGALSIIIPINSTYEIIVHNTTIEKWLELK